MEHLIAYSQAFASEGDIRRALSSTDGVIEWETVGYTFLKSAATCVIVRAGSMGGDTREVHGGWKFPNPFALERAWQEILTVAGCYNPHGAKMLLRSAALRTRR